MTDLLYTTDTWTMLTSRLHTKTHQLTSTWHLVGNNENNVSLLMHTVH